MFRALIFGALVSHGLAMSLNQTDEFNEIDEVDEIGNKIVGGQVARAGQFPYQVSLRKLKDNQHFCGGAILTNRWIVTAAHCFIGGTKAHEVYATVGASNLYDGKNHYVTRLIPHPYFHLQTVSYDIGLATVKTPFTFDTTIQPIPITRTYMAGGDDAFVTGWGRFYENGPIATTLQFVRVKTVTNNACINTYRNHPEKSLATQINNGNICTNVVKGKGFCSGDSGGPLVSNGKLIGVVSWSPYGCTYSGYPDVYTRVRIYKQWIDQTMASKYFQ